MKARVAVNLILISAVAAFSGCTRAPEVGTSGNLKVNLLHITPETLVGPFSPDQPVRFQVQVFNQKYQALDDAVIECEFQSLDSFTREHGCTGALFREGIYSVSYAISKPGNWRATLIAKFGGAEGRFIFTTKVN